MNSSLFAKHERHYIRIRKRDGEELIFHEDHGKVEFPMSSSVFDESYIFKETYVFRPNASQIDFAIKEPVGDLERQWKLL